MIHSRFASAGQQDIDLTISAAISLQNALQDIARLDHVQHSNVTVHLNLGTSGTLQRQIEEGAPVDLFLSAAETEMNALENKGLIIRDTRKNLFNSLELLFFDSDPATLDRRLFASIFQGTV
jgi:molybdate transport system substrate-binding protein